MILFFILVFAFFSTKFSQKTLTFYGNRLQAKLERCAESIFFLTLHKAQLAEKVNSFFLFFNIPLDACSA